VNCYYCGTEIEGPQAGDNQYMGVNENWDCPMDPEFPNDPVNGWHHLYPLTRREVMRDLAVIAQRDRTPTNSTGV
jgi:hypothetical protein